jgi:hypothetical protein
MIGQSEVSPTEAAWMRRAVGGDPLGERDPKQRELFSRSLGQIGGTAMAVPMFPGEGTKEEITGPLVDYLRSQDARLLRVYIIRYAFDRRHHARLHNPWVLSWYAHGSHQVPAKMPLRWVGRIDAKRPSAWAAVPPAGPPKQLDLLYHPRGGAWRHRGDDRDVPTLWDAAYPAVAGCRWR